MSRSDQLRLDPQRRSVRPHAGDTFASLAERELPELDSDAAVELLATWNPHLGRSFFPTGRPLLVSDIVYLEPAPS